MKRRNQGYVLALVLVVTLLLSSVASLLTVSVVRNIQLSGSNFAAMAEAEALNGMIEQYFAHLKYDEAYDDAHPLDLETISTLDDAQAFLMEQLETFATKFKTDHSPADPKAELEIVKAVETEVDAANGKYCYLVPVQAKLYADEAHLIGPLRTAAAIISVSVTYIEVPGEEGADPSYQLVFDSVEYASYQSA